LFKVLFVLCIGSGLYFLYCLKSFEPDLGRLSYGSMFDPNDLSYFALSFIFLNILFVSRENPYIVRLTGLLALILGFLLIVLSGSRGGMLAFCISALFLLFCSSRSLSRSLKFFLILVFMASVAVSAIDFERYRTLFSLEKDYNVQSETGRLAIWAIGARAMQSNPVTGVGVGCFSNAVGLDRQLRGLEMQRWQAAHSSIVQIGAETGIFGLILYLVLSLSIYRNFRHVVNKSKSDRLVRLSELGLAGFLGIFISGMFLSQAYSIYWAFYLVLAVVCRRLSTTGHGLPPLGS
jgi:O-antigen ligase